MQPRQLVRRLQDWLAGHPGAFLVYPQPAGVRLVETATGKALMVEAAAVAGLDVRRDSTTGAEYLLLSRVAQPPLALAAAGFAFALDTCHTGPLRSAPPAMSFADYARLRRHLLHLLETQDDPEHRREALEITMVLIASLDGARASGLPVGVEEEDLETLVRRLEAGT